jgi:hypothetical protein
MSDNMRWRYGETNPVQCAVNSATVIEIGDLVWLDTDDAKPASDFTWDASIGETQDGFSDKFLGVAMQRSLSGETEPIRVATTGVFEFTCASAATWELGNLAGPAKASGNALEDQKVVEVTDAARSVGKCVKASTTAITNVLVDIKSTIMLGGEQVHTASVG